MLNFFKSKTKEVEKVEIKYRDFKFMESGRDAIRFYIYVNGVRYLMYDIRFIANCPQERGLPAWNIHILEARMSYLEGNNIVILNAKFKIASDHTKKILGAICCDLLPTYSRGRLFEFEPTNENRYLLEKHIKALEVAEEEREDIESAYVKI